MKTIKTAYPETPIETMVRGMRHHYGEQALGIALAYVHRHHGTSLEPQWRQVARELGGTISTHLYSCGCHVSSGAEQGTEYDHLCADCIKGDRT